MLRYLLLFIAGFMFTSFQFRAEKKKPGEFILVIDAGHGGKDPGCHGLLAQEKNVALSIALELEALVKESLPEVRVIMTRRTDVFVELDKRAAHASSNKADFFISIHCNANDKKEISGTETYAMGLHKESANLGVMMAENSVILMEEGYEETYDGFDPESPESYIVFSLIKDAFLRQSLSMATKVENQFKEHGRKSRGVKQAGFLVLWRSGTPAILVESGFLTHREEEKYLHSDAGQKQVAMGVYKAFHQYKSEMQ
jgi:N-acetylmuramoyl-L-alanine amidase